MSAAQGYALLPDPVLIAAAATDFVAAISLAALSSCSHARSPRPSHLIHVYLFITLLLDVAVVRTAWITSPRAYSVTVLVTLLVKAILVVLESWHKTAWLLLDRKAISPETTSSLAGLSVFAWLYTLLMQGYHGFLSLEMLYPLDRSLMADTLSVRFQSSLKNHPLSQKHYSLVYALIRTLWKELLLPVFPRLVLLGASFCQPLLVESLLNLLQQEAHNQNYGYGLILATFLTYSTIALSTALYWYLQEQFVIKIRGCLVLAIYQKTTKLDSTSSDDSSALTIMSTDVERTRIGILSLHEFWANFAQVGIACWLLQAQIGAALVAPIIIVILTTGLTALAGRYMASRQRAWMEAVQNRVSVTADAITQMKVIKMSGMVQPVERYIQKLRVEELALGGQWRMVITFTSSVSQIPMLVAPCITLAVTSNSLDTSSIFVTLSYLTLLASPLMILLQKVPQLISAFTCLERIQIFLQREERADFRSLHGDAGQLKKHIDARQSKPNIEGTGTTGTPMDTLPSKPESSVCLSVANGYFSWHKSQPILKNVNISIPRSKLTVIVGPVGSGKSTLCKALLGEIPLASGTVSLFQGSRVGYCDQQPFLANQSIRDNVIGSYDFSSDRYQRVLAMTMLSVDLSTMALGDQAVIGSGGISLSGGQRQRLSIARALYAFGLDLLVFDDVLSGLDATTEDHIFRHVFGPAGFTKQNSTSVILCTHNERYISIADHVIRVSTDGTISEQGLDTTENAETTLASKANKTAALLPIPTDNSTQTGAVSQDAISIDAAQRSRRQTGDKTIYQYYLKSVGKMPLFLVIASSICFGFLDNFPRVILTYWANDLGRADGSVHSNSYWIGIYGFLQAGCWIASTFTCIVIYQTFISRSGAILHQTALTTIVNATLGLFTQTDVGVLVNYFSQDTNLIDTQLPSSIINVVLEITTIVGMAALLASSAPWLAMVYPALGVILSFVLHFYLRTSRQVRLLDLEAKSPLYSQFMDTLRGIATIRSFGWVTNSVTENKVRLDQSQQAMYLLAMIQRWLQLSLGIIVSLTATALVVLMIRLDSSASISGASLVTLMTLSQSLVDFVTFYAAMETSIGAVTRIRTLEQTTESEQGLSKDNVPAKSWPANGEVLIHNAWASYPKTSSYSLNGLKVNISPGEKVALCGRTGSGKSSFILLLLALLEPAKVDDCDTTVKIDGESLISVNRRALREQIITIPQDTVFLPPGSTIAQNVDPNETATKQQCKDVLSAVGL